jgi:hypothetical protein
LIFKEVGGTDWVYHGQVAGYFDTVINFSKALDREEWASIIREAKAKLIGP